MLNWLEDKFSIENDFSLNRIEFPKYRLVQICYNIKHYINIVPISTLAIFPEPFALRSVRSTRLELSDPHELVVEIKIASCSN